MVHAVMRIDMLVWMTHRRKDQWLLRRLLDTDSMRIFTWDMNEVPRSYRYALRVDLNVTLAGNEINLMIAIVLVQGESCTRRHSDKIGAYSGAVYLFA